LDCAECEAYLATQKNDRTGLEQAAAKWAKEFGAQGLTPEMCVCDGCRSGKRVSTAHAVKCGLRLCATGRGVESCAHCTDYGCATLQQFFSFAPVLKDKLEAVRRELGH
jgi:hypothetical protein